MKSQRSWESMRLTYLGNVAEVVQQGGGKLTTPNVVDPGEPRKVARRAQWLTAGVAAPEIRIGRGRYDLPTSG